MLGCHVTDGAEKSPGAGIHYASADGPVVVTLAYLV